jgi:hypothetical protein
VTIFHHNLLKKNVKNILLCNKPVFFSFLAASPAMTDIALKPCEIESCQRISATLCHHCNKNVCRRHFVEHADQLMQELNPLADSINELGETISSFCVKEYKEKVIDKLIQWRDQAIQNINDLYELTKQKLGLLLQDNEDVFLQRTTSYSRGRVPNCPIAFEFIFWL